MSFSDETLMAYADGELDAATRAAVEAAAAADPQLAGRIARHRQLRARLRAAFDPVIEEPVPQRLLASARGAGAPPQSATNVIALRKPPRWSWPQWSAMAASLVVGTLLGSLLLHPASPGASIDASGGRLVARGALAQALSQQLASARPPAAPVAIGVSFRAKSGAYCRTFVLHEQHSLGGLACREGPSWQVVTLEAGPAAAAAGGGYVQAQSTLSPAVARTLDELIAGEPLDARAEAAARARNWTP